MLRNFLIGTQGVYCILLYGIRHRNKKGIMFSEKLTDVIWHEYGEGDWWSKDMMLHLGFAIVEQRLEYL